MDYRREIDGLRALAVLPVILFHAGFEAFSGGFVGVDVFFVISGYLITTIILTELGQGKFSIVNFYERRARRILPALFLVMLVCLPFAWFWLLPDDIKGFSKSLVAVSVFASNILFWRESGYFDTASELKPLLHTWSLAVEEQYYVLFPLFLMLFWRLGKRWILIMLVAVFVASLAAAQWGAFAKPVAAFYLLPARGWELVIGAFSAFYLSKAYHRDFSKGLSEIGGWLGVALILYAVFAYDKATPFPGFNALVPTVGAVLIIFFATQQTTIGKFVGNKAFVSIGLISYSAYLWHQPLFAFARHRSLEEPSHLVFAILSIVTFVLAYFSWRYVEAPFRNRESIKRTKIFILGGAITSVFFVLGLVGDLANGFPHRLASKVVSSSAVAQEHLALRDAGGCHLSKDMVNPKLCVKGDTNVAPRYLLVGDSHAASLAFELAEGLKSDGKSFSQLTKNACPPGKHVRDGRFERCEKFNEFLFTYLDNSYYDAVIISARWSWYLSDDKFDNTEGGIDPARGFSYTAGDLPFGASLDARSRKILDSYTQGIRALLQSGKKIILV